MPVNWEKSSGDVLCNLNSSQDVVVIFGSAHGGWDYSGLLNEATGADIYGIRDTKVSWFQDPGASFSNLFHIDEYFSDYLMPMYPGKKVFCGVSMGASAALYFGSRFEGASIIAASPQIFQYQFLWDQGMRTHYEMIEKMPDRLRRRKAKDIEVIVSGDDNDPNWNWRDKHAAELAEDIFGLPITRLPSDKHASWQLFSMKQKIEERLGSPLFPLSPRENGSQGFMRENK